MEAAMPYRDQVAFEIKDFSFGVENSGDESAHAAISLGDGETMEAAGEGYGIGEWGDGAPDALGDPVTFTYTVSNPTGTDTDGTLVDSSADPSNEIVVSKATDYSNTPLLRGGDTFDFQPELTSEPTAPEPGKIKMEIRDWRKNVQDGDLGDTFDFQPELTSEPTDSQTKNWIEVESIQLGTNRAADGDYLLTAVEHTATEGSQLFSFNLDILSSYEGSHVLYQDVVVPEPAVAMETLTVAHEGSWLV
jgi:hypothetical protein